MKLSCISGYISHNSLIHWIYNYMAKLSNDSICEVLTNLLFISVYTVVVLEYVIDIDSGSYDDVEFVLGGGSSGVRHT
jgi:hypothetical protein